MDLKLLILGIRSSRIVVASAALFWSTPGFSQTPDRWTVMDNGSAVVIAETVTDARRPDTLILRCLRPGLVVLTLRSANRVPREFGNWAGLIALPQFSVRSASGVFHPLQGASLEPYGVPPRVSAPEAEIVDFFNLLLPDEEQDAFLSLMSRQGTLTLVTVDQAYFDSQSDEDILRQTFTLDGAAAAMGTVRDACT